MKNNPGNKNKKIVSVKTITGAQLLLESLLAENVTTLFGYPGGAIIPVYDALYDYSDKLRHILVRHEQGAIHAAQGYARSSGKTGVVIATSGPGATNLVTGLADAMADSTPVVCITGQVYSELLGTDAFQETDIISITIPVTKWNCQVTDAKDITRTIAKAMYIARSGRPGPVLIDITKDAQLSHIEYREYTPCSYVPGYQPTTSPDTKLLKEAADLINCAARPLVLLGQGIILGNAEPELKQFVEKSGIPAAATTLGLSALSSEHPLYVGMLGMHGNYAPNVLTNEADLIIAIGMRFDDRVTGKLDLYAPNAKIIHIDIDPSELNKNVIAKVPVCGDCKNVLRQLIGLIKNRQHTTWLKKFHDMHRKEEVAIEPVVANASLNDITMADVVACINDLTKGEAIIVTDVGQHQMIACRLARFEQTRSNITSGGLGTMGFALPAAIGAKLSVPERTVIAIIGDGGMQMTLQELGTIMQYAIDIKIVILNNSYLGMVRQWQELFHNRRYSFVNIPSPDFVALAKAYKISGKQLASHDQMRQAIAETLATPGPYLLEVKVRREQNVFPMIEQGKSVSEVRLY